MKKQNRVASWIIISNRQTLKRKFFSPVAFLLLLAHLNLITGCYSHNVNSDSSYKYLAASARPGSQGKGSVPSLTQQKFERHIILHRGENIWSFKALSLSTDRNELYGKIEKLSPGNVYEASADNGNQYQPVNGHSLYDVDIYVSDFSESSGSNITIPLSAIGEIDVLGQIFKTGTGEGPRDHFPPHPPHPKMTPTGRTILIVSLIVVGVLVIVAVIIALTKSSCPFVYVDDGTSYRFTGEMYGGAIFSSLERDDYMPLPELSAAGGRYRLKISNELLERQYTNLAELMVVAHPDNSTVLADKQGNIQSITDPAPPLQATSDKNSDFTGQILYKDSSSYLFNDDNGKDTDRSSLILSFKKPLNAPSAKLVLNAKNSFWLDYIYGKFNEQFGTYYNRFAANQKKVPASVNNQWALDQGIPLAVYLDTENGWELVDYFNTTGPLASRDLVMPIDLSKVKGDQVQVKLVCGFMFWEVDYAAMDFSPDIPVTVKHLAPASALDENGKEVASLLAVSDDKYLIQPKPGNEVTVTYAAPVPRAHYRYTSFLHSRGYYEYIRDYKNKPELKKLNTFKQKGAFARFSKEQYYRLINNPGLLAAAFRQGNQ